MKCSLFVMCIYTYLRKPMEAGRRVNKVESISGKQSAVEGARHGGNEARPELASLLFPELSIERRQRGEDVVEVIGEEVIQMHLQLRRRQLKAARGGVHGVHHLGNHQQRVRPRRTSQVSDAQALCRQVRAHSFHNGFLCCSLRHREYLVLHIYNHI